MSQSPLFAASVAACLLLVSCSGNESPPPTGPSIPPPVAPPQILSTLVLEGNLALTSVGETSQLKAMASYTNGSSADVSSQAIWNSDNSSIIGVSAAGLVSVTQLGNSFISARLQNRFAGARVIATPPGTVTVSGQVREPGQGGGMGLRPSDVRVLEPVSGRSVVTDATGLFSMGGLTSVRFQFERDDLERTEVDLRTNLFTDVPVQRIVRVNAGESVTPVPLVPNDVAYTMSSGDRCFPCRMIRVDLPSSGVLHLRLTWTGAAASLGLWIDGQRSVRADNTVRVVDVDLPVNRGQLVAYVQVVDTGLGIGHVSFTLETSLTP